MTGPEIPGVPGQEGADGSPGTPDLQEVLARLDAVGRRQVTPLSEATVARLAAAAAEERRRLQVGATAVSTTRQAPWLQRALVSAAAVSVVLAIGARGMLPDPVQTIVSDAGELVNISVPRPTEATATATERGPAPDATGTTSTQLTLRAPSTDGPAPSAGAQSSGSDEVHDGGGQAGAGTAATPTSGPGADGVSGPDPDPSGRVATTAPPPPPTPSPSTTRPGSTTSRPPISTGPVGPAPTTAGSAPTATVTERVPSGPRTQTFTVGNAGKVTITISAQSVELDYFVPNGITWLPQTVVDRPDHVEVAFTNGSSTMVFRAVMDDGTLQILTDLAGNEPAGAAATTRTFNVGTGAAVTISQGDDSVSLARIELAPGWTHRVESASAYGLHLSIVGPSSTGVFAAIASKGGLEIVTTPAR